MFNNYNDTFVPVYYHFNGDGWQSWVNTRRYFYVPSGTTFYVPHLYMDGFDRGTSYTQWASNYLARQPEPTDVTVDVGSLLFGTSLDAAATVCVEAGGTGKDLRVYMVQVLDHYPYPTTYTYYRNCFRQVHVENRYVDAGACVELAHTFTVTTVDTAIPENIGVVVWAQQPFDAGPAEVYQAGRSLSPTMGLFRDDFENGDTLGWSVVEP